MHDDERHVGGPDILLEHQVPIYRDKVRETSRHHRSEQVAVAASEPAFIRDRRDIESGKGATEPLRDTLVEQDPHSGRRHSLQQKVLRHITGGYGLLAADAGKVCEELIQWIARLEVLDQRLHRNPGTDEDQGAAHDLGVAVER